jgi:1-deoxy-D-xylulose-5-phosphate reductoisomerase
MVMANAARERLGVAVLGSTGSVGRQTLEVIDAHRDRFRLVAVAARHASDRLRAQVARYRPELAVATDPDAGISSLDSGLLVGMSRLAEIVTHPDVNVVVVATSGHASIEPTIMAIEHRKTIALANKETLVCAGEIIMPLARQYGVEIRPVDSEHSAIWQALGGVRPDQVERIILTASGGPFRDAPREELVKVSIEDALSHPTWSMGGKITIDSATMMNKGLEIIEAHWLFGMPYDRIEVVIHPESIIHSLVEFVDGGQIAQLGLPDMRLPIQYALSYPDRLPLPAKRLRLDDVGALHFSTPDEHRFPALRLAREAGVAGRTYPTVLSASDEVAVEAFLKGKLRFLDIPVVVERVLANHVPSDQITVNSIAEADAWSRRTARQVIAALPQSR